MPPLWIHIFFLLQDLQHTPLRSFFGHVGEQKDMDQWMSVTLLLAVARQFKLPQISTVYDLQQVGGAGCTGCGFAYSADGLLLLQFQELLLCTSLQYQICEAKPNIKLKA